MRLTDEHAAMSGVRALAAQDARIGWPASVAAVVIEEAERRYPEEGCGLLLGSGGTLTRAEPIANGEDRARRRTSYLLSPGAYRRAEAQARAAGLDVVGVFHSHPDHPARPSPTDLDAAWPGWVYVIVPVAQGRAGSPLAWRLRDDRSGFDAVPLVHQA